MKTSSRVMYLLMMCCLLPVLAVTVLAQTPKTNPQKGGATLLIDTDEPCQLSVDGVDLGSITPADSKKVPIEVGEHIVKAYSQSHPDVIWRKVVNVDSVRQFAVLIGLKAMLAQQPPSTVGRSPAQQNTAISPTPNYVGSKFFGEYKLDDRKWSNELGDYIIRQRGTVELTFLGQDAGNLSARLVHESQIVGNQQNQPAETGSDTLEI